jgi:hypothetical protein
VGGADAAWLWAIFQNHCWGKDKTEWGKKGQLINTLTSPSNPPLVNSNGSTHPNAREQGPLGHGQGRERI